MNLDPQQLLSFAERYFDEGVVLRHNEICGEALPIVKVVAKLKEVMAAGGEHDAVDLVLLRRAARPTA